MKTNFVKKKSVIFVSHMSKSHNDITYISDYSGLIYHVAVHPSILAPCGCIESIFPDVTDVPIHRHKHPTPAEGPILLPRQSQVQLLM